jgi:hypothetical protein
VRLIRFAAAALALCLAASVSAAPFRISNSGLVVKPGGTVLFEVDKDGNVTALGSITGSGALGGAAMTCTTLTASGLITANAGIDTTAIGAVDSMLNINGLAGTSGSAGGSIPIRGGDGHTNGAGGATSLTGGSGAAGGTGNGGASTVVGGTSGSGATGNGGAVGLTGGAALSTNGGGGAAPVTGGAATGTGTGGLASLTGGASGGASGTAGGATVDAGAATGGTAAPVLIGETNASYSRVTSAVVRPESGTAISASAELTKAALQTAMFWSVNTTGGAVDVDLASAAMDAADVGSRKTFAITAGTNALTVTAGTGITTVTTIATLGAACEDVGDFIECLVTSTSTATCVATCAD